MKQCTLKRERINDEFNHVFHFPLTIAVAAMGYGKTTAARDFLNHANVDYAWLSVESDESSPQYIWDSFTRQLARTKPELGNQLRNLGFPIDAPANIGESAFSDCSGLIDLTIEGAVGVTGTSIGAYAFSWCGKLETATLEDGVAGIGDYGFYHCYKLTSVTISNTVQSIGAYAFYSCIDLTGITIPESVESIGASSFAYCASLANVTIGGDINIGDNAFARYGSDNIFREVYEDLAIGGAGKYSKSGGSWEKLIK